MSEILLLLWKSLVYLERSETSNVWVDSKYASGIKNGNLSLNNRFHFIHKIILGGIEVWK